MENIRNLIKFDGNYSYINREERNLAAIFYYAILQNNNSQSFLKLIKDDSLIMESDFGIYFEYSYIRDLWRNIDNIYESHEEQNRIKRDVIIKLLKPDNAIDLMEKSTLEFNKYFGCVPDASTKYIQSPGNWSLLGNPKKEVQGFNQTIKDNEEFAKVCKFKWSFNIKPDIVIHTSKNTAVCIEAKLESGEGHYPSKPSEEEIFKSRGLRRISQTWLQKYMMEELLGIKTKFIFLVQNGNVKSDSHNVLTWNEVFKSLDTTNFHSFVLGWIRKYTDIKLKTE